MTTTDSRPEQEEEDTEKPGKRRKDTVMATVEEAIQEFRAGRFVIIIDDVNH